MADDAVAALDCGTNSTRLLIADSHGTTVERHMRITRLGEAVDATHKLSVDAIGRTISVLREYKTRMDVNGVERARLVATSAARDAVNADEFLTAAEQATGARPELLTGDEEGRLSFAGATASLPTEAGSSTSVLVVDIGGGSTELVAGVLPPTSGPVGSAAGPRSLPAPGEVKAVSLDIGCVRLTERFLHHDPPLPSELADATTFVESEVRRARAELPAADDHGVLIGLAGTVSTLAAMTLGISDYDRSLIHHFRLSRAQVDSWRERLGAEDHHARLGRPGMVEGRADVILGGVIVLAAVLAGFWY
ncbi:MAG: exopolyphosphatase, partial [Acidimicrobiales bacterium]